MSNPLLILLTTWSSMIASHHEFHKLLFFFFFHVLKTHFFGFYVVTEPLNLDMHFICHWQKEHVIYLLPPPSIFSVLPICSHFLIIFPNQATSVISAITHNRCKDLLFLQPPLLPGCQLVFSYFFLRQRKQDLDQNPGWCQILSFMSSWRVRYEFNMLSVQPHSDL